MTPTTAQFRHTAVKPAPSRSRKLVAFAVAILSVLVTLTACGITTPPGPAPKANIAFVLGARANQVNAAASDPGLDAWVNTAVKDRATVTVVNAGGEPSVIGTLHLANDAENSFLQQRQANTNSASLRHLIGSARVSVPEANTLSAIDVGARAVRDGRGLRVIVVVDSGVTTVGLRVQDGLLANAANAAAATSWLAATQSLPDLHGVLVVWLGLGQTCPPQPALPIAARNRLQSLWGDAITKSGGTVRFVGTPITPAAPQPGLPSVTVVNFTDPGPGPLPTLTDAQVGFVKGQTTLRDPAAAAVVFSRLAQLILAGGYRDVWLTGTASSEGQSAANVLLAAARARLVADRLQGAGVPGRVLHTRGLGSSFPGYVPDRNPDGSVNESRAVLNRLVIVSAARPAGW